MREVTIPISSFESMDFLVPDTGDDYTLQMQVDVTTLQGEYLEKLDEFNDFLFDVEDGFDDRDEDEIHMDELEYRLWLVRNKKQQLLVLLSEDQHNKLEELPEILVNLLHSLVVVGDQEYEPICEFINKDAVTPDIEYWEEKKSELSPDIHQREIWEIDKKLDSLKTGAFILVPVQDNIFQSKINTDHIMKDFPTLSEVDRKALEKSGWDLDSLKTVIRDNSLTEKQLYQKKEQIRAIKQYYKEYKNEMYGSAGKLLSHVCVPKGHQYNADLAKKREKYYSQMPISLVGGLLAFFLRLIEIYQKGIVLSSQGEAPQS